MIDYDRATAIATKHLDGVKIPDADYVWELKEGKETKDGWVFDYSYVNVKNLPPDEWEAFVGAPAFIVYKLNGAVRDLSWEELSSIR